MKHSTLTRLLPWLVVAVCPLLGRCGGDATEHSTETGNPPVVEQQKLHVVLRDTGVEVVGDAGAVSPGATVRVTNRSTGESTEATARADGSVNIVVPGSPQDEYEVTVSNASGSQTVQVSAQTSSDAADAGGDGVPGTPCTALRQTLAARVAAGFAKVEMTCQRDEECFFPVTNAGCYNGCPSVIVSLSGGRAAAMAIAQDIAPLCKEFEDQRCETPILTCNAGSPTLACSGTCKAIDTLGCDELSARAAERVPTVVSDASRACSRDNDCALIQADLRCVSSCGNFQSVASSALEDLQRSIAETQGRYCGMMEDRGCPGPVALPCTPSLGTPRATCSAGQCEVVYAPLP